MKHVNKVLTYIIAIILTILIVTYFVINLLSSTIMSEKYILSKLEETNYYKKVYEQVESNFEKYIKQSGLDEDVIKNLVSEEKVKNDTEQILVNLYDGITDEISTEDIKNQLNTNITKSLDGRRLTTDEEEAVSRFVDIICNEYKTTILHTNQENNINQVFTKILKHSGMVLKISIICIGVSIIALIIINLKKIYRTINAIGISMTASGLILIVTNTYINIKVKIQEMAILNTAFSEVLRNVLNEIVENILHYGIILAVGGVVLIIVSNLIHNIRKYGFKLGEEEWKK